jgi:amidase
MSFVRRCAGEYGLLISFVGMAIDDFKTRNTEEPGVGRNLSEESGADPTRWSASHTAEVIRAKKISVPEVARAYVERSEQLSWLAALTVLRKEEFLEEAAIAQRRLDSGDAVGPLHGVPFTVKDLIATAGVRTAAGSRILEESIPRYDATSVARLKAAGGLLLGKSNCAEFGFGVTTENELFGTTHNPWDVRRSPGGSSGGESALVAAGGTALGLGTDYGGSLRWPAHSTGVFALRPTPGRVPSTGQIPGAGGSVAVTEPALSDPLSLQGQLQVVGPLARCVGDLELALGVLAGPDGCDSMCVPTQSRQSRRPDIRDVPIGWCIGDQETPVGDDVAALMESVVGELARDGCHLVHQPFALVDGHRRYNQLREIDPLVNLRRLVDGNEPLLGSDIRQILANLREPDDIDVSTARMQALLWRLKFYQDLEKTPVLLAPIAPGPAVEHTGAMDIQGKRFSNWELMAFCRAVSLAAVPVVAVPCGLSSDGLPLAVQVVAPPFREDLALSAARRLEKTFGGWIAPPGLGKGRPKH